MLLKELVARNIGAALRESVNAAIVMDRVKLDTRDMKPEERELCRSIGERLEQTASLLESVQAQMKRLQELDVS